MKVLVAVASKHGSTREIADVIAEELRHDDIDAEVEDVSAETRLRGYDAVILGSAVYMGNWLPEARNFVEHHQAALSKLPVWLFSSGPLGTDDPQPHDDPNKIIAPMGKILARSHKVFVGKLDPSELGFGERFAAKLVHAPYGDFRDWDEVRKWALEIATELHALSPTPSK
jgi:menaquinone-dependent protoporphyrinogen oxidase